MSEIGTFSASGVMTMARGRNGDLYGVNGLQRGFRWDGVTASVEQLGISAPASKPTVTASGSATYFLHAIDVIDGGSGYVKEPAVTISGNAKAKAEIEDGRVTRIIMQDYGSGYSSQPTITIADPDGTTIGGSGAAFTVTVNGRLSQVYLSDPGSGYTDPPTVTVTGGGGSGARVRASINVDGAISALEIENPGSGYTGTPTLTFSGSGSASVEMRYRVASVSTVISGSGYTTPPRLRFASSSGSGGAFAEAVISGGVVIAVSVVEPGDYLEPPVCQVVPPPTNRKALARPALRPSFAGKFWCAIRYVDDTVAAAGGPIASSISELTEIEVSAAASQLSWSWSNAGKEARVSQIELWRTTADQALVLYRVATLSGSATSYTDTLGDSQLASPSRTGFKALPVVLPNGQPNARRFRIPPQNKSSIVMFQDRAWYGVDAPGRTYAGAVSTGHSEPNTLYFSEVDEPESVPEPNELILQDNVNGGDRITALMPFGGAVVVFQERHAYRLTYAAQPVIDANFSLIGQRGCLNQRCWVTADSVAYVADSSGIYVLDGAQITPLTDGIEPYWSRGIVNLAAADKFFMVSDPVTRIVRFFFSASVAVPDRALCYHPVTQAWWEEQYAQPFGAAAIVRSGGRQRHLLGGVSGLLLGDSGGQDIDASSNAASIACQIRTGNFPLTPAGQDRSIRILYDPTASACELSARLHYNNNATPRPAAVSSDRGTGFRSTAAGHSVIDLASARSPLGEATGFAVARYAGRLDDHSAGGDRHIAVALALTAPAAEQATVYGMSVAGAGS
jgi:hypothetical protein